ncbi:MAG TPA: phosphatase PAP2 family protein [Polyangiaceae bacterium]|nr:phosphatase PAP2 family protein [Polyangiaceae bacterium]
MSERAFRFPRAAKRPPPLSPTAAWAAAATGAAYFGVFLKVSDELFFEGERGVTVLSVDRAAASWAAELRRSWLTQAAIEVTSLGSVTVLGVVVVLAAVGLYMTRDRLGGILLASATLGAIGWTSLLKNLIERERPPLVARLVVTSGYSFPSGHSLASASILGALALIACRHLSTRAEQLFALGATAIVICAVAASRVYLGVHYLTDVTAGTSFGLAWVLAWAAVLSALEHRRIGTRV